MGKREICGNFPGGYAMCDIIDQDDEWLKFRDKNGREGWARPALGTYCERDKDAYERVMGEHNG